MAEKSHSPLCPEFYKISKKSQELQKQMEMQLFIWKTITWGAKSCIQKNRLSERLTTEQHINKKS